MAPTRILPAPTHVDLHDTAATRAVESAAAAQLPTGTLMRRAGLSVSRWVRALHPHAQTLWVAAGPGGNGGDGLHAAAECAATGWSVSVSLLASPERLSADSAQGLARAQAAGVRFVEMPSAPDGDVAVDALLGLGCERAPEGRVLAAVHALQQYRRAGRPVLAVDVPTGLHSDRGTTWGDAVVTADATLSLLTLKPGLFTAQGRARSGDLWLDALCTEPTTVPRAATARLSGAAWHPLVGFEPRHLAHKGSFGDVLIIGGAPGMHGAARLAAHAAQAAGAGRTLVSLLDAQASLGDTSRPEWLWVERAWRWSARDLRRCVVVCGCGGGDAVAEALPGLLAQSPALVLDADGLNAVARDPSLQTLLADRASRGQTTVLTPHPLEAARLLDIHTEDVQEDRLQAARALADRFHAVTLLKGSGTVICAPGTVPWINSTGHAALAHGGSGDVLAGWIGGLLTRWRGLQEESCATAAQDATGTGSGGLWDLAQRCACASAWLHGAAAETAPAEACRPRDLVDAMHRLAHGRWSTGGVPASR